MASKKGTKENPYTKAELGKSGVYFTGDAAVNEVQERMGRKLTKAEKRIIGLEGFVDGYYLDSKGVLTRGVGQTRDYAKGNTSLSGFDSAFQEHVESAKNRKNMSGFGNYSPELQAELIQAEYRGDLGFSPTFRKLLEGATTQEQRNIAADEFLNNDDYRKSVAANKANPGSHGIQARMDAVANQVRQEGFNYKKAPGIKALPQEVVTETNPLKQGIGAIKNWWETQEYFEKGGPVKNKYDYEAPVDVSVEDVYKNYRMQEAARRSMMQGNDQDRMDDYAYAREQARRPFVNRYPVDSRGQGAYSTAAPMRNQAARMMGFASGGSINTQGQRPMMTNPQTQANGLASLGRGGDSTLVHMQPQEVAGLQQLAQANGTSLTTNPDTGMPEAFKLGNFFKAALPIAAGFFAPPTLLGLGATGSAIAAGAATGGTLAAMSGEDVLAGTLSGGMGGYSGMGLESAVMGPSTATGMGGTSSIANPMAGATPYASQAGSTGVATGGGYSSAAGADGSIGAFRPPTQGPVNFNNFDMGTAFDQVKTNLGTVDPTTGAVAQASPLQAGMKLGSPLASMGMGGLEESDFIVEPDFNDPRDKYDPYSKLNLNEDTGVSDAMRADTGLRLFGGGGTVGPSSSSPGRISGAMASALGNMQVTNNSTGAAMDTAGMTPEEIFRRYFRDAGAPTSRYAEGGDVGGGVTGAGLPSGTPVAGVMGGGATAPALGSFSEMVASGIHPANAAAMHGMDTSPYLDTSSGMYPTPSGSGITKRRFEEMMSAGYAQGGYLNTGGKVGDGMSDSIPATINGDQPAALSDGEFVIPADVVSHLGNGSSSAGAQRLKDMMSRLRKARTGNEEQGKQIAPKKYMPA